MPNQGLDCVILRQSIDAQAIELATSCGAAMETMIQIDLGQVAREVALPLDKVQVTVELLDDGNTVPFVTRFRKDQTGGLDEEQIRRIQEAVNRLRALTDRKQRILKSLETQARLTSELAAHVQAADSLRRLEDLYLPFKPKKQTLAGLARSRGLDSLAHEIVAAQSAAANLEARAAEFVNADRGLPTVADVLQGAGHLIAEMFSENYPLRDELREFIKKSGKLISTRIEESEQADETLTDDEDESAPHAEVEHDEDSENEESGEDEAAGEEELVHEEPVDEESAHEESGHEESGHEVRRNATSNRPANRPSEPPAAEPAAVHIRSGHGNRPRADDVRRFRANPLPLLKHPPRPPSRKHRLSRRASAGRCQPRRSLRQRPLPRRPRLAKHRSSR